MTVTFEEIKTGQSVDSATVVSASLTGVTGHGYVACLTSKGTEIATSVTGLGLTWTREDRQISGRNQNDCDVWTAQGTASTGAVTANFGTAAQEHCIAVYRLSGVHASAFPGNNDSYNTNGQNGASSGGTDTDNYSFTFTTSTANSRIIVAAAHRGETLDTFPGDYTERADFETGTGGGTAAGIAVLDRATTTATGYTVSGTFSGVVDWAVVAFEVIEGASVTSEQEGYRFRNDDGSESAATWKAAQDTNVSLAKSAPFRLRVLSDMTGDAPTEQATLQYKRTDEGASEWRDV